MDGCIWISWTHAFLTSCIPDVLSSWISWIVALWWMLVDFFAQDQMAFVEPRASNDKIKNSRMTKKRNLILTAHSLLFASVCYEYATIRYSLMQRSSIDRGTMKPFVAHWLWNYAWLSWESGGFVMRVAWTAMSKLSLRWDKRMACQQSGRRCEMPSVVINYLITGSSSIARLITIMPS